MNVRTGWSLLFAAAAFVAACDGRLERSPRDGAPAAAAAESDPFPESEGSLTEAERTRAMESRAAELEEELDAAMSEAATDAERQRAYEQFEAGRLELNEMAESESVPDDGDAYPPPPAP